MTIAGVVRESPDARGFDPWVRVFDSSQTPVDDAALETLQAEVRGADLAGPAVALPDFHQEPNMEAPCSIAVATRDSIRPTVSNASVNCGMALIALDAEPPDTRAVTRFYRRVQEEMPYPAGYRAQLQRRDVLLAASLGAWFSVERFGFDPAELDRVEEGGRLEVERHGGADRLRRELPLITVLLSRLQFATVGPSNHFIELQQVERLLDPGAGRLLGVQEGQLTLQYHAGGGVLTGLVGRMFGRRTDFPRRHRAIMAVQKPLHHLASARSLAEFGLRRMLYFSGGCPPVSRSTSEGQRMLLANAAAMNYGFAFRLAVYSKLRTLAAELLGARDSRLVVDSPHDSLYEEEMNGESVVVHRYKACRAYPAWRRPDHPIFGAVGQPLLLPGTNRTSSYLCVADVGAGDALYSACHGTGSIIADFEARGLSGPDPHGRTTLRFRYGGCAPEEVVHLDDRGIDEALDILTRHRILRPVARLRPLAVLT